MPAETHSHRDLSVDDIRTTVVEHAADLLGIDPDAVDDATVLPDDAVAVLELVGMVEEEVGERTVGLDADDAADWTTVGDVIEHVCERLGLDTSDPDVDPGPDPDADADAEHDDLARLEAEIGHTFADRDLLMLALRHRSWCAENAGLQSNERLEFLGDSVLGIVVTDTLYRGWPDLAEGVLAKARSAVVNSEYLAEAALGMGLGTHLLLGKGEAASGGSEKPSILADAVEAVIGAVYLDGGLKPASALVHRIVDAKLDDAVTGEGSKDYKTRLQEYVTARFGILPSYSVEARGPDHAKTFLARVTVAGTEHGQGRGRSKKQAEQGAARAALSSLQSAAPPDGVAQSVDEEGNG